MKGKFRGQYNGAGKIVTWFVMVILAAGLMPTLMSQINITLPLLDASSPERLVWSMFPFIFVLVLAVVLIFSFMPGQPQQQMVEYPR